MISHVARRVLLSAARSRPSQRVLALLFVLILGTTLAAMSLTPMQERLPAGPHPIEALHSTPDEELLSADSATCLRVHGETDEDLAHLVEFCARGLAAGAIVGAQGRGNALQLNAARELAVVLRWDAQASSSLLAQWERDWRSTTGYDQVSIVVKWDGIVIASGGR